MSEVDQMLERSPLHSNLYIVVNHAYALKIISNHTKAFLTKMGAATVSKLEYGQAYVFGGTVGTVG